MNDKAREYKQARDWHLQNGYVKVGVKIMEGSIQKEWLWCKPIEDKPGLLEVCNTPFFVHEPCLEDVIEVWGEGPLYNFGKVIEHINEPLFMEYDADMPMDELKARYTEFCKACREYDFKPEGMRPGYVVVAVPWGTAEESIDKIIQIASDANLDMELYGGDEVSPDVMKGENENDS